ncbi:hypothetical protein [Blastopirellula marina]|uniref:Squalene cyclase C-terminal domain-containing protein n=1 Tax=Blastopirellula marina TaxID=124 RepID=A0A2S8GCF7_9BACT|nr:hypothetical protein [Blastopirellula marina]PQO42155.1 hypothetical protein C5Y93_27810 [Blastopirellula marina]
MKRNPSLPTYRGIANTVALFTLAQVLLLGGIVVAAVLALPLRPQELPSLQNEPRCVTLQYDWPQAVTDGQLTTVMLKLRPRLRHEHPKINHVDHALRCWGAPAMFDDPSCLSGADMVAILTDQHAYEMVWDAAPLLVMGEFGPGFRTQEGAATASHVDHTLGTLAEIGMPLDYPLVMPDGTSCSIEEVLIAAMRDFRLNQKECEWTTVAAASYATGPTAWISQDGERVSFDLLAHRLMRQDWVEGVCYGNHRLYSLAMLLQFDEQVGLFQHPETRSEVMQHLTTATARLVKSQAESGYWDENWEDASRPAQEAEIGGPQSRRILATGHTLEWWAIAPAEVLPPREVIVRAAQWLVTQVEQMEPKTVTENYTFLSHVGRALCMWRGKFPHEICQSIQTNTAPVSAGDSENSDS